MTSGDDFPPTPPEEMPIWKRHSFSFTSAGDDVSPLVAVATVVAAAAERGEGGGGGEAGGVEIGASGAVVGNSGAEARVEAGAEVGPAVSMTSWSSVVEVTSASATASGIEDEEEPALVRPPVSAAPRAMNLVEDGVLLNTSDKEEDEEEIGEALRLAGSDAKITANVSFDSS